MLSLTLLLFVQYVMFIVVVVVVVDIVVYVVVICLSRTLCCVCDRVFSDRLNDTKDNEAFVTILSEKLAQYFDQTYHNICHNRQPPIFGK